MKASELIENLQQAVDLYGDKEINIDDVICYVATGKDVEFFLVPKD